MSGCTHTAQVLVSSSGQLEDLSDYLFLKHSKIKYRGGPEVSELGLGRNSQSNRQIEVNDGVIGVGDQLFT
jgi:hypothetical protein